MIKLKSLKSHIILKFKLVRAKKVALICDVDGVLTDGKFYYSEQGKVFKVFGSHDSDALNLLTLDSRVSVYFVTADSRGFNISKKRLNDMGFDLKLVKANERIEFIKEINVDSFSIYVGDSFTDIDSMEISDLSIAPKNAHIAAKRKANLITNSNSSEGALSEVCLLIIKYFKKY